MSRYKEIIQYVLVHYLKASMSGAEHMMEGVSRAEAEEMGRGQPLLGLPVHGKKKKCLSIFVITVLSH